MKNDLLYEFHCNSQSNGQHMKISHLWTFLCCGYPAVLDHRHRHKYNFSLIFISIVFLVLLRSHCSLHTAPLCPNHQIMFCSPRLLAAVAKRALLLAGTMDFMLYNINITIVVMVQESEEVWKKKLKRKTKVQGQEIEFLMLFSLSLLCFMFYFFFFSTYSLASPSSSLISRSLRVDM